jgi:hypothetical protein
MNRTPGVQMQQTDYRCGSDSWRIRQDIFVCFFAGKKFLRRGLLILAACLDQKSSSKGLLSHVGSLARLSPLSAAAGG